jgi:hypothetical protein
LGVESETDVVSEVAQLRVLIDREAAATGMTLTDSPAASEDDGRRWGAVEQEELHRQLASLREYVACALSRNEDPGALRAELATPLSFAKTLRTDAETWRAAREEALQELELQEDVARQERERLAAKREELVRRRDALQFTIDETAKRVAHENGGGCRRTMPVLALGERLIVCSVIVASPRRGFRSPKRWLVTLNDSRDQVLVTRD